jgi:hypothetical protein
MQVWFNICKPLNVIKHINESKDKNHLILPIEEEKAFHKIQHCFIIKGSEVIDRMYLKIIKAI